MSEQFVSEFIGTCIANGKNSPPEICAEAQKEVDILEEQIRTIELLRTKQANLRAVIRQLGGSDVAKRSKRPPMISESSVSVDDLDPYMRNLCINICAFINKESPNEVTPRSIMDACGSLEENKAIYTAIKWLLGQGIVAQVDHGATRAITPGERWDDRPVNSSN